MSASPYYDVGVYLLGAANHNTNANLNANWVQGAQPQGWGLIPIWVGPQAPCVDNANLVKFNASNANAEIDPGGKSHIIPSVVESEDPLLR
jgi:hypothetical protein